MSRVYYGVLFKFGKGWYEVWVPDVVGATVVGDSEDQVKQEIVEQLEACLENSVGGVSEPSSKSTAVMTAFAELEECMSEYPGDYNKPQSYRLIAIEVQNTR